MADVRRAAWRPFRIPFREEFRAAHGLMAAREGCVVVVEDADGVAGLGDACPLPSFTGETMAATERALDGWLAQVRGDGIGGDMPPSRAPAALAAIETAVLDLHARLARRTFSRYLARATESRGPAPDAIPVNAVLPIGPATAVAAAAVALVAEGFATLKLKVGGDPAADRERVLAVRAAAGPGVRLRLDANGTWTEAEAVDRLAALAAAGIDLVEQPVAPGPGDAEAMRRIRAATGVPVAADESLAAWGERAASLLDGLDAVVLKPGVLGVAATHALIRAAARAGLAAIVTTGFDTGIGTALAAHLAGLVPEPRPACGLDTLRFLEGDIVTGAPVVAGGQVALPTQPGLGLELDETALERFATGPWREVRA